MGTQTDSYAALFTIIQRWKQPKHLSIDNGYKKCGIYTEWNIHQIESNEVLYVWLTHVAVWQKPTQYCKAIILPSKINFLKKKNL